MQMAKFLEVKHNQIVYSLINLNHTNTAGVYSFGGNKVSVYVNILFYGLIKIPRMPSKGFETI